MCFLGSNNAWFNSVSRPRFCPWNVKFRYTLKIIPIQPLSISWMEWEYIYPTWFYNSYHPMMAFSRKDSTLRALEKKRTFLKSIRKKKMEFLNIWRAGDFAYLRKSYHQHILVQTLHQLLSLLWIHTCSDSNGPLSRVLRNFFTFFYSREANYCLNWLVYP